MLGTRKAYAKVNLGLHVVKKTKNGYHKLDMIMSLIDLYDDIEFYQSSEVVVETDKYICNMKNNLCYLIANFLKEKYAIEEGIKIIIKKNIPDGAGLGGGSSDAAEVLKFLNEYWKLNLSKNKLKKIGFRFGCDIPFFIEGQLSEVQGYGEKIKKLKFFDVRDVILIFPKFKLSTKEVFGSFHNFNDKKIKFIKKNLYNSDYNDYLFNDLESSANIITNNKIEYIKCVLSDMKLGKAVMSGSGSTLVYYLNKNAEVLETAKKIQTKFPDYKVVLTKLMPKIY